MEPSQRAEFDSGKRPALTEAQHTAFLQQLAIDEASSPSNPDRASMRVDTLAQMYLDDRKSAVCVEKFRTYSATLKSFCEFCGAKSLTELTPSLVRKWKQAKGAGWKSTSTIRNNYKVVLQMVNFAVVEQIIPVSPLVSLGKALASEAPESKKDYCIYEAERSLMLAAASPEFKKIIQVLLGTGRRPGEIAMVKKSEVKNTASGLMLRIAHHKNKKKTGKPETIYLTPEIQELTRIALADESNKTPFLFTNSKGLAWTTASIGDEWNRVKKAAGLDTASTPYSCRHSYITLALINRVALPIVAYMVGDSVGVIAKHYAHIDCQATETFFNAATQAITSNKNYRSEEAAAQTVAGKAAI